MSMPRNPRFGQRTVPRLPLSGQPEIVSKLQTDLALRRLYVLTTVGSQPLIVTFVLYAVISIEPPLADVSGGTEITITTEGIMPSGCAPLRALLDCIAAVGMPVNARESAGGGFGGYKCGWRDLGGVSCRRFASSGRMRVGVRFPRKAKAKAERSTADVRTLGAKRLFHVHKVHVTVSVHVQSLLFFPSQQHWTLRMSCTVPTGGGGGSLVRTAASSLHFAFSVVRPLASLRPC